MTNLPNITQILRKATQASTALDAANLLTGLPADTDATAWGLTSHQIDLSQLRDAADALLDRPSGGSPEWRAAEIDRRALALRRLLAPMRRFAHRDLSEIYEAYGIEGVTAFVNL